MAKTETLTSARTTSAVDAKRRIRASLVPPMLPAAGRLPLPAQLASPGLSREADPADRALPAGRRNRYGRAVRRAEAGEAMKATIVVDNRTGAGGAIGAAEVAKADPDGYTLLFVAGPFTTVAAASKNPDVRPGQAVRRRSHRSRRARSCSSSIRSVPAASMREFIALAKREPGKLNYGSAGHRQHQPPCPRTAERARRHGHRPRARTRASRRRRSTSSPARSRR